jgi:hypothetical protein
VAWETRLGVMEIGIQTKKFIADYVVKEVLGKIELHSLQLRVLGFCLLQDGDVGVGVFPEREEVFVSR